MIGVFDSGVGGLTVVRELLRQLPGYQVVYFGDTARTPYGTKGEKVIAQYTRENIALLREQGAKLIIAACNTASAVSYETLQAQSDIPVFEVITPTVQAALAATKNHRIGVIGTSATITTDIYRTLLKRKHAEIHVSQRSCPLLVPLVEEGWFSRPETKRIIRRYLSGIKQHRVDTLILGCTHYPFLRETIQAKMGKRTTIIDSAEATVASVRTYLAEHPEVVKTLTGGEAHRFLFSDPNPHVQKIANQWLGRTVKLEEATAG